MVLYSHRDAAPHIDPDAYLAPTAVVSGAVTVGAGARILHNAVVTAEDGEVIIGRDVVVMEHALIRGRAAHPCSIGDSVMIGPNAHVNGAVIHDRAFIATGASVFPGAVVGEGAEVRINAIVQVNTTLVAGAIVPIGWVAVGSPAQLFSPDRHDDIWVVQRTLDFVGTVYGVGRESTMADIMRRQSEFYGAHRDDEALSE